MSRARLETRGADAWDAMAQQGRRYFVARLQSVNRCLILFAAVAGGAMVFVAMRAGFDPDADLLSAAGAATLAAVFLLAAGVVLDGLMLASSAGRRGDAVGRARRQVLEERLELDEPRLCSHAKKPCSVWSLCGSEAAKEDAEQADAAAPGSQNGRKPMVWRRNPKDCPFE